MPTSALSPVQAAIYAKLAADSTLQTLLGGAGRIVDTIREGQSPGRYVYLGEAMESPDDTLTDTGYGSEVMLTIYAYADDAQGQAGNKTVQQIASRVIAVLHDATLTVSGKAFVSCEWDGSQQVPADGQFRRIALDFRVLVED
jgi:hypothetical protein